jgi:hypothetical protein
MKIGDKLYNKNNNLIAVVVKEVDIYHRFAGDIKAYQIKILNTNQIITFGPDSSGWEIINNDFTVKRK